MCPLLAFEGKASRTCGVVWLEAEVPRLAHHHHCRSHRFTPGAPRCKSLFMGGGMLVAERGYVLLSHSESGVLMPRADVGAGIARPRRSGRGIPAKRWMLQLTTLPFPLPPDE